MSITKLFPLIYLVAKASAMWLPQSEQEQEITNIENCICPMKSPSIINKLDSNNSGVERLVIYVYRKPDTGEIVSFIPEKEHQRKIPDLPETNGRVHDEQNPSIKEIFEKSSSKDLRQHIRPNKPLPHHKYNEGKDSLFVINGKLKIPNVLNENNNEKYFESEVEIPKWQIPVDDVTSESYVRVQHINKYPRPISEENTYKKTETIDNDDSGYNKQQHPISEDSTLDISSEYITNKPHTYEEYPVSVKPLKIENQDREDFASESTLIRSFESQGQSEEKRSEPVIPEEIESPRHKEHSSFEDSIYIRPHRTEKNQIPFREQEIPKEIEFPRHKDQSSFEDSFYIRPHVTGKPQISHREPATPEEIELPRHREQSSFEDSSYIKPHIPGKSQIFYRDEATPEEIELPRHREQSSLEDSSYIRPHIPGKSQIYYRDQAAPEEIELPWHREQSSFEDSSYIRPHIPGKPHISYIRPDIPGKTQIYYRDQAAPEEIEMPRHREQSSFEDSSYIRPHIPGKSQIYYREQATPEEIELPRHREQSSFEDSSYIKPHISGKSQIYYRDQVTPEEIELPRHREQSSLEDSSYIRPHIPGKSQIYYRDQVTPEEIELPRHREQSSFEDSSYIRPYIPGKSQIYYSEQATPEEIELPRHREQSSLEDSIFIRPHRTEKNQISFREDQEDMVPMVKRIKVPRKDKYGRIIGWIIKTIITYKKGGSNTHKNWREYQKNQHKLISHHYTDKGNWEKDSAFDEWLKEQLRITTLNGNRIPTSKADIMTLDRAIRNVLLQNGWLVTDGTLVDGTGKTSSLNNLKLRPILVGKSYSYDNVIKQGTHKLDMSKKPYLEGLLLTMIKPAKILGIVPLSITSYSQTRSPYDDIVYGENASSKRQKEKMKVLPIEELVSFRKDSKSSKSKPEGSKSKIKGSKKKKTDAAHLKNALSEIQQSHHGKGTTTTIIRTKGKVYTGSGSGSGKRVGTVVSEEVPDWRIIGGISATISGTPLDFKGRSGAPST